MVAYRFLCLMLFFLPLEMAFGSSLASYLDKIINDNAPRSYVGVIVGNAETGKILYEKNSQGLFTPASNEKLFTAAAALYLLGPNYRFKTVCLIQEQNKIGATLNGNLYIRFSGDPTLTSEKLQKLIQDIKSYGINFIAGDIVVDETRFDKPDCCNEWILGDTNWYYAPPITSIILDANAIGISINPSKGFGERPLVEQLFPERSARVMIDNQLQTQLRGKRAEQCVMNLQVDQDNTVHFNGCVSSNLQYFISLRNPFIYAKSVIENSLLQQGIILKGRIISGSTPQNLTPITIIDSVPLFKIVEVMLKESNNLYAESVLKTLGYIDPKFRHGSFQDGVGAIKEVLRSKAGIDFRRMKIIDGSGLAPGNLLTPYSIYKLLYAVYNDKDISGYFRNALAKPNEFGTLQNRWSGNAEYIRAGIAAKTGTMSGKSALSGYLTTQHGSKLFFSILINNIDDAKQQGKILENKLCMAFIRLL